MIHSHNSSRTQSRLIVDDLCAQLAPLDMYGLANLGSAGVDCLIALTGALRKGLRTLVRARSSNRRPACGATGAVVHCQRPGL